MRARCGDVSESKSLCEAYVVLKVAGTLRVRWPRLGDSGRHTECACYFGCGLAALGLGGSCFFQQLDPGAKVVAVVVEGSTANEVAVDDAGFIDERAAADF